MRIAAVVGLLYGEKESVARPEPLLGIAAAQRPDKAELDGFLGRRGAPGRDPGRPHLEPPLAPGVRRRAAPGRTRAPARVAPAAVREHHPLAGLPLWPC